MSAAPRPENETAPVPELAADALRWRCDPGRFDFETTNDVERIYDVIGQATAVEALQFGLETDAPGQNIFVRGLHGSGRMTLIQQLLPKLQASCEFVYDYCYVNNFDDPQRPALVKLPAGEGRDFRKAVDELISFISNQLAKALSDEKIQQRQKILHERFEERVKALTGPFETRLKEAGFALVSIDAGESTQMMIVPLHEGKPIGPEEFDQLHASGAISEEDYSQRRARFEEFIEEFRSVGTQVQEIRNEQMGASQSIFQDAAKTMLSSHIAAIRRRFDAPAVNRFLDDLLDDIVDEKLMLLREDQDFVKLYRVNVIRDHDPTAGCPIVVENVPTLSTLLGSIDAEVVPGGVVNSDHTMICGGSILRADGGYLILEAADVLAEPAAWKMLMRSLRTGKLEIIPRELIYSTLGRSMKPEPIELHLKVILIGDAQLYAMLDAYDADFRNMFKVLADFDSEIARDDTGVQRYAGVLARIGKEENLTAFDAPAVALLAEHGARIAGRANRLTTRFGRLADIAREASYIAQHAGRQIAQAEDVREAVRRTKRRGDLPSRKFRQYIADGTILIETAGTQVGQMNGLAVLQAGPLTYGFPARITATVGPGTAGIINIERESQLSGSIHTKGFHILRGLMRNLLRTDHPPVFSASLVFEQSYGGIDGDSASGAETCCLLSALTNIPIRQELAMTGAIDQFGNILAIGGVNEKIEGFFDTCRDIKLTGTQGVIIPKSNAGDLMLREDVVEAAERGEFHIYAVSHITQALELLLGQPAGKRGDDGRYPEGTVLHGAMDASDRYWKEAIKAASGKGESAGGGDA